MFFIGAYWSARKESQEQAAERMARFFRLISKRDPKLAVWFMQGRTRQAANRPLGMAAVELATRLKVQRRDIGGETMPELGFSIGAWNGDDVSFHATLGSYDPNPNLRNFVVLSYSQSAKTQDLEVTRAVLEAAVAAFAPEQAVATSNELLTRTKARKPWEVGWLTYERGGVITEHAHAQVPYQ